MPLSTENKPTMTNLSIDRVIHASKQDVPRVVDVLAQAFHDDPLWRFAVPDPAKRARTLPHLFRVSVNVAVRQGEIHTSSSGFGGAAVWMPPGKSVTTLAALRLGLRDMLAALFVAGPSDFQRIMRVLDSFEARQKHDAPGDHWYLMQIGVLPEHQGRGIGSQLLTPMFERFDQRGEVCYLETETPENVTFYEKRGFRVVTEAPIKGGGPTLWTMIRQPQPAP
jgi:ribosomal protein S18 acetylase RimI-like enzyme